MTLQGPPRILCVDDEPNVLSGLERMLADDYDVTTARSGAEGLKRIAHEGPFEVVVSDMRMPVMDGARFLERVRSAAPDAVRVLLTGHASVDAAIAAVNDGGIFRFLLKPASDAALRRALADSTRQHRLIVAERDLLERTLKQTVEVLTEVLSMASPVAFAHARRLATYAAFALARLPWERRWEYEVAILLSQVGYITAPTEVLERSFAAQPLRAEERKMLRGLPSVASELVARIPRLDRVAAIIAATNAEVPTEDVVVLRGGQLLRLVTDFDHLLGLQRDPERALATLRGRGGHDARLVDALEGFGARGAGDASKEVRHDELTIGMQFVDDVVTKKGVTVVRAGSRVTTLMLRRLENFAEGVGLEEPFRVLVAEPT